MHWVMLRLGGRDRITRARAQHQRLRQSGFTMVEVVIALFLAGMVVLSLAIAMLAIVRTNALNSERQRVDAAMTSFSESVRGVGYVACGASPPPSAAAYLDLQQQDSDSWSPPTGIEVDITEVDFWDGAPGQDRYVSGCPAADGGAQRLTLRATLGSLERSAQVVIRR